MKKYFTFILVSIIFSVVTFAQSPVITNVYEHSIRVDGSAPDWMGDRNRQRNMAYYDGKLYIPSTKTGNQIVVIDAATGLLDERIDLPADPVSGGAVEICGISITSSGKILVGNLITNSQNDNFKVYSLNPKTEESGFEVSLLLNYNNAGEEKGYRCGDNIAVYGDITEDSSGYIMTANTGDLSVLRWDIENGVVSSKPDVITLDGIYPPHETVKIHYGPVICPVDENRFILNSARMHPTLYDMDGNTLSTFDGDVTPQMAGISGLTHFNFKERSFIVSGTTNYITGDPPNAIEFFEIIDGEFNFSNAVSLGGITPETGYGDANNGTYIVAMAYDITPEEVFIYVMVPANSIACYKLTIDDATFAENFSAGESLKIYPVPVTDVLYFSAEMKTIELFNYSGQLVRRTLNADKVNVGDLRGLYIVKAVNTNDQSFSEKIVVE